MLLLLQNFNSCEFCKKTTSFFCCAARPMPSPKKGPYSPAWLGKPKSGPKFDAVAIAAASLVRSPPLLTDKTSSPVTQRKTSKAHPKTTAAEEKLLQRSVNNKAANLRHPTDSERAYRVVTTRHAAGKLEQKKLAAYKRKKEERRRAPIVTPLLRDNNIEDISLLDMAATPQPQLTADAFALARAEEAAKVKMATKIQNRWHVNAARKTAAATIQARQRGHHERVDGESKVRRVQRQQAGAAERLQVRSCIAHIRIHYTTLVIIAHTRIHLSLLPVL